MPTGAMSPLACSARRSKVSAEFAQDLLTNAKVVFAIYTFVVYLAAMKLAVSLLAFVAVAFSATTVPLPLSSPAIVALSADPVVIIGTRTIDFTTSLGRQFIHFLPVVTDVSALYGSPTFRNTVGVRARDTLASIGGALPASPDPLFPNALPSVGLGTSDLILFDIVVSGLGTPFSFTVTDANGVTASPSFANPVPEPSTTFLAAGSLAICIFLRHIRRRPT